MKRATGSKEYTISFMKSDRSSDSCFEYAEFTGDHFPARHFRTMIRILFERAAENIEYQDIRAIVCCDGFISFIVKCKTIVDGSRIWANLSIDNDGEEKHFRTMVIAD